MNRLAPLRWLLRHPVTRQHPVRTAWRWLYWQVRQRLTGRSKIMPFIGGTRLEIHPREGLTGYWYLLLPEYEEMMFLLRFLKTGDVFYDVGANAGAFAVLAAAQGASVVAFEPVPHTFERLNANTQLNEKLGPITPLNCAVGSACGNLRMSTGFGTGNRVLRPGEDMQSVEVPVLTLDEVVRKHQSPTFLKIDVEGHELEVLRGAQDVLRSEKLLGLLVETFRPHNWQQPKLQALEKLLREHGFLPYGYDPGTNRIFRLERPEEGEDNTLYIRSESMVTERLGQAAR